MVERLGWTLVHFVWEGAVVAALLAVALLLNRRASAGLRYGLALSALVLLAALPAATFIALAPAATTALTSGALRLTSGESISGGSSGEARMPILVGLWAAGVVLFSLRLVGAMLHLERWRRRHAQPASPEEQARFDSLARRLGLRRRVALFLSDRIEVPSAWGVFRPVVVFPASLLTGLSPAQIEGILLHELAHVRRHDYLVNLIQGVVETALFYHPAVWWVSSVVRREREHLCDDVAVASLGDPMPYARALLQLEERRQAPRPALSAKEGNLMNRIARILSPKPAPTRLSPLTPSLAALAVVGLALGGVLRAEAQSAASEPKAGKSLLNETLNKRADALHGVIQASHEARLKAIHKDREMALLAERAHLKFDLDMLKAQLAAEKRREKEAKSARILRANGSDLVITRLSGDSKWIREGTLPKTAGVRVDPMTVAGHIVATKSSASSSDRAAQDWAAMQKAQAELAQSMAMQRKAILSAQGAAAKARARADYDMARAQQIDPARREKLIAEAKAAQADAAKAWSEATQNRESFIASSAATQARIDEAVKAAQTNSIKDLEKALASQREAQSRASNLQGTTNDLFKNGAIASTRSIFGSTNQLGGQGAKGSGLTGDLFQKLRALDSNKTFQSLGQTGAPVRINALTYANDFSLFGEPKIEMGSHGKVSIDAKDTSFSAIVRALARKGKLSVVIERGMYRDVSLVVSDRSVSDTLAILCKAADANLRSENGVYYVSPKRSATTRGFGGGFGFDGGVGWGNGGGFGSANGGGFGAAEGGGFGRKGQ